MGKCIQNFIYSCGRAAAPVAVMVMLSSCGDTPATPDQPEEEPVFYFGADLSYVNQVVDHGGVYKENGTSKDPYQIFSDRGANLVRFRLWHNPSWTREVYGAEGRQQYNNLADVEEGIRLAKEQGMEVLLDFHYSDNWADPDRQEIPAAWRNITNLDVLKDSVYRYTLNMLLYLQSKSLMPELVQLGNEINCGMLYTDAPAAFPTANACQEQWQVLGELLNSGIRAVREVSPETKVVLHVADPKNVIWWFDNIRSQGEVTDFDVVGFSYYPLWHTTVTIGRLSDYVANFKSKYNKEVMLLETAYPWTTEWNDNFNNAFSSETPLANYPFTPQGQLSFMVNLTQEVIDGGGSGVIYWEPAWISSQMKDQWGTGSSWENVTFFDFSGNTLPVIEYMKHTYSF